MQSINTPLLVNRYRILQTLGAGGFGETFLAEDTHLPSRRRCVIKRLIPVTNSPQLARQVQQRFEREAVILEQLGEENQQIPDLYAYFESAGQYYLVQEFIDGVTLTKRVQTGGILPAAAVRDLLLSLLPVLGFVHRKQMVHRDIKPDNIILRHRDGQPVLIDFGAVKEAMSTAVNTYGNTAHTLIIGTPGYMPNEQAAGQPTYSSDLYALGLVAIYLLTGKEPQELPTDPRTSEILWRSSIPAVDAQLADAIDRAIRFHPADRFQSAQEMLSALQSSIAPASTVPSPAPAAISTAPTQVISPGRAKSVAPSVPSQTLPTKPAPVIRSPRFPVFKLIGFGLAVGIGVAAWGTIRNLVPETTRRSPAQEPTSQQPTEPKNESPVINLPPSSSQSPRSQDPPSDQPATPQTKAPRITLPPIFKAPTSPPESSNDRQTAQAEVVGFPVGTSERTIRSQLGEPTSSKKGYWPNTRAVRYENYVPGQITLGYLFDNDTGRLRQTEASFVQAVDLNVIQQTVGGMLGGNTPSEMQQGLQRVYDRQINQYEFATGRLKGVIERNKRDRIYIGVWDAELH